MKTSANGVDLIKRFEGLELEAYQDIAGVWTIGYGHTGAALDAAVRQATGPIFLDVKYSHFWTVSRTVGLAPSWGAVATDEEHAELLLRVDLIEREKRLNSWRIMNGVDLNQNEFDALISFIYNVGFAAFRGSTAARWLREGKPREKVAEALTWWNKATVKGKLREVLGLTRRRAAERKLFLTPDGGDMRPPTHFFTSPPDTRESNACPAKEQRPVRTYLPNFVQECVR